ncbi:hypothetical protein ACH79_00655 [Bradyrhizobium sp. CCBAU 051011]|nr:hypothetical protein ACH79_00655 [Bradyrhizobium sp. CCBAU 051011]
MPCDCVRADGLEGPDVSQDYKNDQQQVMSTHHAVFAFHLQTDDAGWRVGLSKTQQAREGLGFLP